MVGKIDFTKVVLCSLWLPISNFASLRKRSEEHPDSSSFSSVKNSTWSWVIFKYHTVSITIDSLGFIYLENVQSAKHLDELMAFLVELLTEETKVEIRDTFLNRQIGYKGGEKPLDKLHTEGDLKEFLKSIVVSFESIENRVKLEYIYSSLYVNSAGEEGGNVENKYKISSSKNMKFSLDTENFKLDKKFQTILNRNFENLLKKSIHYTHSLNFDEGEIYDLAILDVEHHITDWINFELFINKSNRVKEKDEIFNQILKKAIQDTLEEYTLFNFLKVTRRKYLRNVTDEIAKKNKLLKRLNAYLLDDVGKSLLPFDEKEAGSDDEAAVEVFIQNLLQSMPKFHNIDSKVKEAYYIKIGNTSTNLRVNDNETIINTLYYAKWKSSIQFFVETASKVNDSLMMYHQNKSRKELEDISYNANYQADIEDIREFQKNRELFLDDNTRTTLFLVAVAALAGEAPLISSKLHLFTEIQLKSLTLWETFYSNGIDILLNTMIYGSVIYFIIKPLSFKKEEAVNRSKKRTRFQSFTNGIAAFFKSSTAPEYYYFDESDYDKHEHRSTKLLLSYSKRSGELEKRYLSYNNHISSYELVSVLKEKHLTQKIRNHIFSFEIFPELLSKTPLDKNHDYIYRENYRISGNDKIATKVMYRYKISDLKLEDLIVYMREDAFMKGYGLFLKEEGFSLEEQYKLLEPYQENTSFLTLYIVYSFVLKFSNVEPNGDYSYTISKDQFRVHYHINKIDYSSRENFELKQSALAKLIDIYFLRRLKRVDEQIAYPSSSS